MMAGYYLLSFVIAFGALALAVGLVLFWRVPVFGLLILFAIAALSLWTAVRTFFYKRPDRAIGGLELTREREPALFAFIEELAVEMATRPPTKIHLVANANAFVAERGGFLGLGTRRILGLGYLTLRRSTRSELRAVLAHELGHYVSGDTALGALVHRSHQVLVRSVETVSREDAVSADIFSISVARTILVSVLHAYARVALRVSLAVARRQELEADRHAVELAGKEAWVRSLSQVVLAGAALNAFNACEVGPLAACEAWPDEYWNGFDAFEKAARADIAKSMAEEARDPFDTHPTLEDRVGFANSLPESEASEDTRPSLGLLSDSAQSWAELERLVAADLPRVPWARAAELRATRVRDMAIEISTALGGLLPGPRWVDIARSGLRCLEAEGLYRIVVAAAPELRQANGAEWASASPVVFEATLGPLVAMALVENHGGAFRHVFGSRLQVTLDNDVHCPWTLTREAAASASGLERLRAVLADRAMPQNDARGIPKA